MLCIAAGTPCSIIGSQEVLARFPVIVFNTIMVLNNQCCLHNKIYRDAENPVLFTKCGKNKLQVHACV